MLKENGHFKAVLWKAGLSGDLLTESNSESIVGK